MYVRILKILVLAKVYNENISESILPINCSNTSQSVTSQTGNVNTTCLA